MQTKPQLQPIDYATEIAALVADLPLERAAQVYDFVRFLQNQPVPSPPTAKTDDGWLDDTEEEMRAEDAQWKATQARRQDEFKVLIAAARAEIEADETQPMFDENGELTLS